MAKERVPRWRRRAYNIATLREQSRRVLPRPVFDFVDGGAGDEHTLRRNVSAFDDVALYPRPIGGVPSRDLSTTLFGRRLSMPLIVPPTGLAGLLWPDGEAASARAATKAGSIYQSEPRLGLQPGRAGRDRRRAPLVPDLHLQGPRVHP